MELFGVGAGEALLVLVITLIVVGPQRFPEIAREGGKWFRVARQFTAEITSDVRAAIDELEEEVTAEGDELRSIREIGTEVESGLKESAADIRRIGRETDADASAAVEGVEGLEGDEADSGETSPAARRETPAAPSKPAVRPVGPRPEVAELQRPRSQAEMQKQLADAYKGLRDGTASRSSSSSPASTPAPAAQPAASSEPPATSNGAEAEGEAAADNASQRE
ncbi:MAG: twin-arginine translocase TatA/TatE family subunit [Dehalococcoidia bacterium]